MMFWATLILILTASVDGQFVSPTNVSETKCSGDTANYNWTYIDNATPVFYVEWKVNGSRIAIENILAGTAFTPSTGYTGRLTKVSNGQISLGSLTTNDTGIYTCEVAYTDGTGAESGLRSINVYDKLNEVISIVKTLENGNVKIKPSLIDESITYTWKLSDLVIGTGSSRTVTQSGNYTLCISGGRADCLNPLISPCSSTEVEELSSCDYSDAELFMGGFSSFLIELAVFIVIVALLKWEMNIGGFTKLKILVSCAFLLIALIIGITLGVVLLKCTERDLSLGLGLGLGFVLAAAHLVIIYFIHKKCDKDAKKDEVERKGTPVSTSNIKVRTDRKASNVHLGTINGNKVDSQPKEPLRPLPVPPAIHPKQLEPIVSVPDDGAPSSEKKKKKKKKKKKSEAREEPEDQ